MSAGTLPNLVVFADDWGRHPSSCQHLIQRLRADYQTLWVNSIGTRKLKFNRFTLRRGVEKLRGWSRGTQTADDRMHVIDVPMLPASENRVARTINRRMVTYRVRQQLNQVGATRPVVMTTLPYLTRILGPVGECGLIYYCTDDYSHWPGADRQTWITAEEETLARADLVLAVSTQMVERLRGATRRCELFPHAVDYAHFAKAADATDVPQELAAIPGPRIGFFGLVYEKLDFGLLNQLATARPDAQIVLIGPIDYCPESFAARDNVHLLGPKPYADLPSWIAGLDLLLLPYVDDPMIRHSSPLKLKECLATGKPIVSVDVPEVRKFHRHVHIAESRDAFIEAVQEALDESRDPNASIQAQGARQALVADESWEHRAATLDRYLRELATVEVQATDAQAVEGTA